MHETGFTKLFSSIVTSSIWQEDKETKILWITMLALSNRFGEVGAAEPGLAKAAGLTLEETLNSLKKLESADRYSRNQDFEGRRIAKIDGGWQILNYAVYRQKMRSRAEYFREYRQRNRNATLLTNPQPIAEAEAEAEGGNTKPPSDLSQKIRIDRSFGKCCYYCGRSSYSDSGRFVWRERYPFCELRCYKQWVETGRPEPKITINP